LRALYDTHAHLDQIEDLERALDDARQAGIVGIVAVGIDMASNERVLRMAEKWPDIVRPALGLHPCDLAGRDEAGIAREIDFVRQNLPAARAVGEIGLDYHKRTLVDVRKELQQTVMRELLMVAAEQRAPALIHSRYAWTDALRLVLESHVERAVFHWFTGFASILNGIIESGYYVSATPAAEYHEEHRRAVRAAPRNRLLLETDTPVWYGRDQRFQAMPSDLTRSLRAAAALRSESEDDLATWTTRTARELIGD